MTVRTDIFLYTEKLSYWCRFSQPRVQVANESAVIVISQGWPMAMVRLNTWQGDKFCLTHTHTRTHAQCTHTRRHRVLNKDSLSGYQTVSELQGLDFQFLAAQQLYNYLSQCGRNLRRKGKVQKIKGKIINKFPPVIFAFTHTIWNQTRPSISQTWYKYLRSCSCCISMQIDCWKETGQ